MIAVESETTLFTSNFSFKMKKSLLLLAAACLLIALSCQKNDPITDPNAQSSESQKMRQYLTDTYGFAPESIRETETDFIVEKDLAFAKANFWEDYGVASDNEFFVAAASSDDNVAQDRRHYRSSYLVTSTPFSIKVNIKGDVTAEWKSAILTAIARWNALDGRFYFSPTYQNYSVLGSINIEMNENLQDDDIAVCYYPTSTGRPGTPLYINQDYNNLESNKKIATIMHELGHAISIRHTDMGQGSLITNVSGTCRNTPDPLSIMHNYNWNYSFSTCDKEAYYALYP